MYDFWMSIPRIGRIAMLVSILIGLTFLLALSFILDSKVFDACIFGLGVFIGMPALLMLYIDFHTRNEGENE